MSEAHRPRMAAPAWLRAAILGLGLAVLGAWADSASAQSADPAELQVRIDQLEGQLRQVTGQVETLSFQVQQLEDRLRRQSEDTEFRFREMSNAGSAVSSSATVASSAARGTEQALQTRQLPPPQFRADSFNTEGSSSRLGAPPRNLGTLEVPQQGSGNASAPLDISPQRFSNQDGAQTRFGAQSSDAGQDGSRQVALGVATDPQGEYDIAYAYFLQRDYGGAELAFDKFLQDNPGHRLAGNAQYWLGESHFAREQYREAADAFLAAYTRYKQSPKAPESLLKLGMSLQALDQRDAACSALAELERTFPQAPGNVKQRARSAMRNAGC